MKYFILVIVSILSTSTFLYALDSNKPYVCQSTTSNSKYLVQIVKNMLFISNLDASNLKYYYHVQSILGNEVYTDKKNIIYYTVKANHIAVAWDDDVQYGLVCKETK